LKELDMEIKFAKRMDALPTYFFAEINKARDEIKAKGVDIVDLGIGDPDEPTPETIVKKMQEEVARKENHNYPPYLGMDDFKASIAKFFLERYSVKLDPKEEVLVLIGSKEGIFHLPFALLNEGDYSLVPDPGYPVYSIATKIVGGKVHTMPLLAENGFMPDLKKIPDEVARKSKIIFVNYPNNPTSACATKEFFEELYAFAQKYGIVVCHDAAYSEVYFGEAKPLSFLNIDKEKKLTIEFHSLSKTFNMTGWRVGFAVGSKELVGGLGRLKTNMDSGVFKAIQRATIAGFERYKEITDKTRLIFAKRSKSFCIALRELGYKFREPQGTFYIWIEVPGGLKSKEFATKLLKETGVVVAPGVGMGEHGDKYFRISLTAPDARLDEAIKRFKKFKHA
jgi:LL-diaminopimelate aminotransferase